jgi:hypothetical protein
MPSLWQELTELERILLITLHESGATPWGDSDKALPILMKAVKYSPTAPLGDPLPPELQQLDDALVGLVRKPCAGRQLVLGQGDYGHPCHPAFRECRLSTEGQSLVLEALGIAPDAIDDEILGSLRWNSSQSRWDGAIELPPGSPIRLSICQAIPGTPFDIGQVRQTFTAVKPREARLRRIAAAGALEPEARDCGGLAAVSKKELHRQLVLRAISIFADGRAVATYDAQVWAGHEIVLSLNAKGYCEDLWVH